MVNCAIVRLTEGFSLFAVIVLYKPPERLTMIDLRRNLSSLAFCQSQQPLCRTVGTRFKFRACSLGYKSTFFFSQMARAQSENLVLVLWRSVLMAKMSQFSFLSVPFLLFE